MRSSNFIRTHQRVRILATMLDAPDEEVFAGAIAKKLGMFPASAGKVLFNAWEQGWLVRTEEKVDRSKIARSPRVYYRLNKRRINRVKDYVQP